MRGVGFECTFGVLSLSLSLACLQGLAHRPRYKLFCKCSAATQTWRIWVSSVIINPHHDNCISGTCLRVNHWRPPELIQHMSQKERHSALVVELLSRGVTFIQHQENEQLIQTCDHVARHLSRVPKPEENIPKSISYQTQPIDLEHSGPPIMPKVRDTRIHPKPKANTWEGAEDIFIRRS